MDAEFLQDCLSDGAAEILAGGVGELEMDAGEDAAASGFRGGGVEIGERTRDGSGAGGAGSRERIGGPEEIVERVVCGVAKLQRAASLFRKFLHADWRLWHEGLDATSGC